MPVSDACILPGRTPPCKTFLSLAIVAAFVSPAFAAEKDIVDTAVGAGKFKTLVAAVKAADLVDTLKGDGPFTVLAPTDEAFAKLPEGTVEALLKPENKDKLVAILTYHVIPAKAMAADVVKLDGKTVKTVQGSPAKVAVQGGTVMVNKAKVVKTDIACSNGVIHVIDTRAPAPREVTRAWGHPSNATARPNPLVRPGRRVLILPDAMRTGTSAWHPEDCGGRPARTFHESLRASCPAAWIAVGRNPAAAWAGSRRVCDGVSEYVGRRSRATSRRRGAARSLGERFGSVSGQSMPRSGSFQSRLASHVGA